MNQHIRYHQMSIECQYISNICQTQMKGKQNNKTNKKNKSKQEKGPRSVSRSKGSKASSSRIRRFKDFEHHTTSRDVTRQMKCLELEGLKASKTLQWLHEGFPLTITPLEKHQLDVGGMESRQNGMIPKVSARICQGAPGCLI